MINETYRTNVLSAAVASGVVTPEARVIAAERAAESFRSLGEMAVAGNTAARRVLQQWRAARFDEAATAAIAREWMRELDALGRATATNAAWEARYRAYSRGVVMVKQKSLQDGVIFGA